MKPDALQMLAGQLRRDPNPDAIEDAAAALEAMTITGASTLEKIAGARMEGSRADVARHDPHRARLLAPGRELISSWRGGLRICAAAVAMVGAPAVCF